MTPSPSGTTGRPTTHQPGYHKEALWAVTLAALVTIGFYGHSQPSPAVPPGPVLPSSSPNNKEAELRSLLERYKETSIALAQRFASLQLSWGEFRELLGTLRGHSTELSNLQQESANTLKNLEKSVTELESELNNLKVLSSSLEEALTTLNRHSEMLTKSLESLRASTERLASYSQETEQALRRQEAITNGLLWIGIPAIVATTAILTLVTFSHPSR